MKSDTPFPNYDECLVNFSNSILKKFGAETTAKTLPMADEVLRKDYKNVVVLLLDALGISIMEDHLRSDGFFRSHLKGAYDSVYPPTTVAATTAFMSGLYPNESGWIGWDCYFPQVDKNVVYFTNMEQETEDPNDKNNVNNYTPAADYNVAYTYCPYKNIIDKINVAGTKAYFSMPFMDPFPQDIDSILKRVKDLCDEPEKKFIYAYWNEPDSTMHRMRTDSKESHEVIIELEKKVKKLVSELTDTLFIVTADHGHVNNVNHCILDYPEILKCLVRKPSIEPRTLNLFVKEEYKEEFPIIFEKEFGDSFWLLTKEEVFEKKVFGTGKDHKDLDKMVGDFLAVATGDESIFNIHLAAELMPGAHAGLTPEEIKIPFIVIER